MSKHTARIVWDLKTDTFDYKEYNRSHEWQFEGGSVVKASAAPDYKGDADLVDPEEAFVASLAGCHMLTFLAVASMKKLVVKSYEDLAEGELEKGDNGRQSMAKVTLKPVVTFEPGTEVSEEEFQKMHDKAHKECFIANSVTTKIVVKPSIKA